VDVFLNECESEIWEVRGLARSCFKLAAMDLGECVGKKARSHLRG